MKYSPILTGFSLLALTTLSYGAQEGQLPPQCPAITGKNDLSAYKGKVIMVDFWATWCGPCQQSMPFMNSLRNQYLQKGFEVIAINVDEDSEEVRRFLKAQPVDYPVAFDPNAECPKAFEVKAMPSSYFIDKTGKIRKIHYGYRESDQAEIRALIAALLAE